MIGTTVSHFKILEKLGEVPLHSTSSGFVGQGGLPAEAFFNH
jgi:hypothetical protein